MDLMSVHSQIHAPFLILSVFVHLPREYKYKKISDHSKHIQTYFYNQFLFFEFHESKTVKI